MRKGKSLSEIRTAALVDGINRLDFTCHARDFEGRQLAEAGFTGDIRVTVVAEKSVDDITLAVNTSAVADRTCDRCLAPISTILTGSVTLYYSFGAPHAEEKEASDEFRYIDKSTEFIDIADDVCDTLLLSLPMKITCINNPDCRLFTSSGLAGDKQENNEFQPGEHSTWQDSLEKLKEKYR